MINIPEVKLVDINLIKVDETNPNIMSLRSYEALKKVIQRYGFLVPIITNKELKIADGFHRYKVALELKIQEIPTIVLDVDEVNRRMLRQILNKLKGIHEPIKDLEDIQEIVKNIEINELSSCLGQSEEYLIDFLNSNKEKMEQWISLRTLTIDEKKRLEGEKVIRVTLNLTESQVNKVKKCLKDTDFKKIIWILEDKYII